MYLSCCRVTTRVEETVMVELYGRQLVSKTKIYIKNAVLCKSKEYKNMSCMYVLLSDYSIGQLISSNENEHTLKIGFYANVHMVQYHVI